MIAVRERRFGSWLDRNSAIALGVRMKWRLWERCKDQPGVFVTLTYDRAPYSDALDLYRSQCEQRHVSRFIARLSKRLGQSLKGQWVRKMEFQQGGWVHWHLIIVGVSYVPNSVIEECWGHGFTKTKGITRERCFYLTKYVTKGDCGLPSFVWGERPRSVKIIASSPGFWGPSARPSTYCPIYHKYGPGPPQRIPGYVPVGTRMRWNRGVQIGAGRPGYRPHSIHSRLCEPNRFIASLCKVARTCQRAGGWLWLDVSDSELWRATQAELSHERLSEATAPRSGALNLSGTSKPPSSLLLPDWLNAWWREQAMDAWLN